MAAIFRVLSPYAEAVKKLSDKLESLKKAQETLLNEVKDIQADSFLVSSVDNLVLDIYTIVGKYPKYQIVKKKIKAMDENKYCLETTSLSTGPIITVHPKNMCFEDYEEAVNKVLQLIQEKTSKTTRKK